MGLTGERGPAGSAGPAGPAGPAGADALQDTGCAGPRLGGACLLSYNNLQATNFFLAATNCASANGDICTDSQSWPISVGFWQNIYLSTSVMNGPHWTASFADNDNLNWYGANGNTGDNHSANSSYGYACCGGATLDHPRITTSVTDGVSWVAIHDVADTYWPAAVAYCAALDTDLCSDSQTAVLRGAGMLSQSTWTNSHSDNDAALYNAINGGTADDTHPANLHGFACCTSTLPPSGQCPVNRTSGVCATAIHNTTDADFLTASRACTRAGADLCSISQAAVLRAQGVLTAPAWTNSHSDNDGGLAAVGVGNVPDNPLLTQQLGYACCRK